PIPSAASSNIFRTKSLKAPSCCKGDEQVTAMLQHETEPALVEFSRNGRTVTGAPTETILRVADRHGVAIPRLCYKDGMRPDGNCRACMVEIDNERVLAPACCRIPKTGTKVVSDSARALHSQKM